MMSSLTLAVYQECLHFLAEGLRAGLFRTAGRQAGGRAGGGVGGMAALMVAGMAWLYRKGRPGPARPGQLRPVPASQIRLTGCPGACPRLACMALMKSDWRERTT